MVSGVLYITPSIGSMFDGNLIGMLGNKNGDINDDFVSREGTLISVDVSAEVLYNSFATSCEYNSIS